MMGLLLLTNWGKKNPAKATSLGFILDIILVIILFNLKR